MSVSPQSVPADPFGPEWFQAARGGLDDADAAVLRQAAELITEPKLASRAVRA